MFSLVRLQAWKIRVGVTIAWLAANPIPSVVVPSSLVNSLRFDKAARIALANLLALFRRPYQTQLAAIS